MLQFGADSNQNVLTNERPAVANESIISGYFESHNDLRSSNDATHQS